MLAPAGTLVSVNWPSGPVIALAMAASGVSGVQRSQLAPSVKGGHGPSVPFGM